MSHFLWASFQSPGLGPGVLNGLRFGSWSGQLGDGRAMSLGHVLGFAPDDPVTEVRFIGCVLTGSLQYLNQSNPMNHCGYLMDIRFDGHIMKY
jgi:hypothetical protein